MSKCVLGIHNRSEGFRGRLEFEDASELVRFASNMLQDALVTLGEEMELCARNAEEK